MKERLLSLLIIAAVALGGFVAGRFSSPTSGRYTMLAGNPPFPFVYLLDTQTGEIWRYYRNFDSQNRPTAEGFIVVKLGSRGDPYKDFASELDAAKEAPRP